MPASPSSLWHSAVRAISIMLMAYCIANIVSGRLNATYHVGAPAVDGPETNILRAGEGFAARGFRSNHGLPDFGFGTGYPNAGVRGDPTACSGPAGCLDLDDPPGPSWMTGLGTKLLEPGKVIAFRLFPIALGTVCLAALAWGLVFAFGFARAALTIYALYKLPLVADQMQSLQSTGYAFYLSLAAFAAALVLFRTQNRRARGAWVAVIALLAFAQGWFSNEWVFVVALTPLPAWLLIQSREPALRPQPLGLALVASIFGFAFAHVLHFWAVRAVLGSSGAAIAAINDQFVHMMAAPGLAAYPFPGIAGLLTWFCFVLAPHKDWFDFPPITICAAAMVWNLLPRRSLQAALGKRFTLDVNATYSAAAAVFAALVAATLWMLVMRNHAMHHPMLVHQLVLPYLVAVLALLQSLELTCIDTASASGPATAPAEPPAELEPSQPATEV